MKAQNPKAYTPQLVSIGPYHHGEPHLLAMEESIRLEPFNDFWNGLGKRTMLIMKLWKISAK